MAVSVPSGMLVRGFFQLARHVGAGHDAGGGGEEDGEDEPEAGSLKAVLRRAGVAPPELELARARALDKVRRGEDGHERRRDHGHHHVLDLEGEARREVRDHKHDAEHREVHHDRRVVREHPQPPLAEAEHVHRHREPLRQVQRHADAAADLEAERLRDDGVRAARAEPGVGGDAGERQPRAERDRVGERDDEQPAEQPRVSHHPSQPEVHDDPEDGQQRRGEDAGEGAEQLPPARRGLPAERVQLCLLAVGVGRVGWRGAEGRGVGGGAGGHAAGARTKGGGRFGSAHGGGPGKRAKGKGSALAERPTCTRAHAARAYAATRPAAPGIRRGGSAYGPSGCCS